MKPAGVERLENGLDQPRVIRGHYAEVIRQVRADEMGVGIGDRCAEELPSLSLAE
jgi:hypothetical protein